MNETVELIVFALELEESELKVSVLELLLESEATLLLLEIITKAAAMIIIQTIIVPQIRINFLLSPVELELSDTTLVFSIGIDSKGLPQLLQNFAESLFAVPHFEHIIYSQPT